MGRSEIEGEGGWINLGRSELERERAYSEGNVRLEVEVGRIGEGIQAVCRNQKQEEMSSRIASGVNRRKILHVCQIMSTSRGGIS